jgi:hypothetical protein
MKRSQKNDIHKTVYGYVQIFPDAQPVPGTRQIVAGNGTPKAKLRSFLASQKMAHSLRH